MGKTKDRLLNVEQVKQVLGCCRRHVYNLIERGDLPAVKIGSRQGIRVKESALDKFISGCSIDPGA
ncbi:MAG: helix-turn-helix domain-containing protein [Desulfobacterales bacterium]|nr:helix-turn-helix domain-containing protein [Desulfobacterales bacterium]